MRVAFCGFTAALAAALGLAACGGTITSGGLPLAFAQAKHGTGSGYLQHVVIVIQENRSFDNFFSTFPGADGTAGGCMEPPSAPVTAHKHRGSGGCPSGDEYVPLAKVDLIEPCDWGHSYKNVVLDYDNGLMDGFGLEGQGKVCKGKAGTHVYQYVDPAQIQPYWDIAEQWVLADHTFQTQGSGSFTAHQDLIAGATIINKAKTKSLIDFPSHQPWGCDAPPGTKTTLAFWNGTKVQDQYHRGPLPCMSYATLRDLLDAKGVSWKYYSPPEPNGTGALWNAFDAIDAVRNGPEWKTNIAKTAQFFTDVDGGTLPAVSWIVPDNNDSDHPSNHDTGPSWVASIVNAVGQSDYWNTSAVIVVWDDWGGFYDHEPPPLFDHWGGLGFRVPMLIVSPYARMGVSSQPGYISHTPYEFGSILKFVENLYGLGSLGTTDKRAASISDSFDFGQPARPFVVVPSKYSRDFFLHEKPSYEPVDSE